MWLAEVTRRTGKLTGTKFTRWARRPAPPHNFLSTGPQRFLPWTNSPFDPVHKLVARVVHSWFKISMAAAGRSEEHTSELQSRLHLVCRLLLEKKKNKIT